MSRSSKTQFAILGMLSLGDKSGYDLKKEFEQRVNHFWSESLGQIYPTLHRLRDRELVRSQTESVPGRPGRTVYRITPAGLQALREWIVAPPERETARNELLLKLFFGPQAGVESAMEQVSEFERLQVEDKKLFDRMGDIIDTEPVSEEQRLFWKLTLLSGQHVKEARIKWAQEAQRMLQEYQESGEVAPSRDRGSSRR